VLGASGADAGADVDWARGLVIVKAVGTADRHAPGPGVARVSSLREAEDRATEALVAEAEQLPGVGTLDASARARLEASAAAAVDVDTQWLPDGSVRIERGLPIEAVRQAIAGPREVSPAWAGATDAKDAPTAIIVDATGTKLTPRVGVALGDGTTEVALPTVWRTKKPGDKDPVLGAEPVRVKAKKLDGATLVVDGVDLAAASAAGALVVVVVTENP
jgi:hypothetical protein